ncbi:septal ring lytic transglycosylase RlpA family protein [Desulfococcaceae bacterium HSG8]|nr:septal ring lytic transglycosylase RlpA family protein [Desulfococcaceae bacterium HSG8]
MYRSIFLLTVLFPFLCNCSSKAQKLSPDFIHSPTASKPIPKSPGVRPYRVMGKWYRPLSNAKGFSQNGIASWYGEDFHGKKTSNGEVFDMNKISAAHKILPLGTYVKVRNTKNNKEIILRINDRGPFVAGRVIDLSKAAARKLGVYDPGTAPVEVVALGIAGDSKAQNGLPQSFVPVNYYKGNFTIQVGAFSELENAKRFWRKLDRSYKHSHITPYYTHRGGGLLYRVAIGKCSDLELAGKYEDIVRKRGFKDAFMVAE